MLDLKYIYDYLNDIDDLFEYEISIFEGNILDLMVAMPNWMLNCAGTHIASFVENDFYQLNRTEDYKDTYRNMTITIQTINKNNYSVVIDFDLMEVEETDSEDEDSTSVDTTEVVPEVAEDPK